MRTFSLLKGLPIIEMKTGEQLGEVFDLSVSSEGKVEGLLLKRNHVFKKRCVVRLENVLSYWVDGVIVEDSQVLENWDTPPEYTVEHQEQLYGKMLISQDGEELGLLQDVYFSEEKGTIVGYELTDGFFSDLTDGKRFVKAVNSPAIGKDAIVVNVEKLVNEVSINDDMPELPQ